MRGFGVGVIWGAAVGLFGLGLASVIAPLPGEVGTSRPPTEPRPSPDLATVSVPTGSEFARPGPETEPVLPQGTPAPATATAPRVPAPQAASVAPAPDTILLGPPVDSARTSPGPTLSPPASETAPAAPAAETAPFAPAPLPDPGPVAPVVPGLAAPPEEMPPRRP